MCFLLFMWLIFLSIVCFENKVDRICTAYIQSNLVMHFPVHTVPNRSISRLCLFLLQEDFNRLNFFIQDTAFLLLLSRGLQEELRVSFKRLKCEVKMFDFFMLHIYVTCLSRTLSVIINTTESLSFQVHVSPCVAAVNHK